MDTVRERESGMDGESIIKYTHYHVVKQIVGEKVLYNTGSSMSCSAMT